MGATIHLVRHGAHADAGRVLTGRGGDDGLSDAGRAQVAWLAERLRDAAAVQHSPQRRTRETAQVIAARAGASLERVDALDEIDFGDWTGRVIAELDGDAAWTRWNDARATAAVPGGESMAGAVARAVTHLDRLARQEAAGPIVCVTHCDIIRGVVAHYLGLSLDRILAFEVDPGSITTLDIGDRGGRLRSLNTRLPAQ